MNLREFVASDRTRRQQNRQEILAALDRTAADPAYHDAPPPDLDRAYWKTYSLAELHALREAADQRAPQP